MSDLAYPSRLKVLICIFELFFGRCVAQDQRIADSLKVLYESHDYADSSELEVLRGLAFNEVSNYDLALKYAEQLIQRSLEKRDLIYQYRGHLQKGRISRLKGNLNVAIEELFKSVEAAQKAGYAQGIGGAYINIGDIYSANANNHNAIQYYNKAINILQNTTDSVTLATALFNAGDEYFKSKRYDSALLYFDQSRTIFQQMNYPVGIAYNLGNTGRVYAALGNDVRAESNINEAIRMLEELEDYYPISDYLTSMADIYNEKKDLVSALTYANRSLELAERYGLKQQISAANLKLSELFELTGDLKEALRHYRAHVAYRDSVTNLESVQRIADLRTNYEVSQKQVEVDLLNEQKRNQQIIVIATAIALILICMLAFGLYRRNQFIRKTTKIIEQERNRSDELLLNILPEETAVELKKEGRVKAKKFESVTVLFTDFKDFTKSAEQVEPEQLVRSIDFYFKAFDEIATQYGLEKIKTIGDAYMCAGGLPVASQNHATKVISAAKDMIDLVSRKWKDEDDLLHFEMRIGVHTGPVVAGIVGTKKWQYDIWGDTVNIASRMESNSELGKINLSETTYQEIKDEFPCEYRGEVEVKNRGSLKMYFLA
jgi:class 3 adenylate cyclase/tetratricopeptide (TPR) repeat protein